MISKPLFSHNKEYGIHPEYLVFSKEMESVKQETRRLKMKVRKVVTVVALIGVMMTAIVGCGSSNSKEERKTEGANVSTKEETWDAENDITIVSREDGSGTRGAFVELLGIEQKINGEKVDLTTEEAEITNSTSVMMTTVAGDEYAIGYISLGALNETVKALKIDGVEATAEHVKDGSYVVSRPFNIAVKEDLENEVAKDFIRFILSREGQEIVSENGYIAMDDVKVFEGTNPTGKVVVGGSSSVSPVMEKLIEAYQEVNPNAEMELQTSDSTTGMTATIEGSYDIGMASRELKEEEVNAGLVGTVIATDGIVVIVNKKSAVDGLTREEVKEIYTGEVSTWVEVAE